MIHASLRELLATGRLGPLALGLPREAVAAALGPPDDHDARSSDRGLARIWRYGDLELHFARGPSPLHLVYADYFDVPGGGPRLALDPWIVSGRLRRGDAERELARAGIAFSSLHPVFGDVDRDELRTAAGVSLAFQGPDGSEPGDRRLVSMSLSARDTL